MPISTILEGEELAEANLAIAQYSLYTQARKLGIKIGPEDVDVDQMQVFYDLHQNFEAIQDKKRGKKR